MGVFVEPKNALHHPLVTMGGQFPKPQVGIVGVGYPLVNKHSNIATENGRRNSGFTH